MLKTVSAALLALSVVAAPALAATKAKTTATAPVAKTEQTTAPAMKSATVKSTKALNANAKMSRHHHKTMRHHAAPKKVSAIKGHATPAVAIKQAPSAAKRG